MWLVRIVDLLKQHFVIYVGNADFFATQFGQTNW
jgi:hypothetical protein